MTASLQNGIRVRLFLIVLTGIAIRVIREYSSSSVHKASGLLETNLFVYGIVAFCSLLPYKNTWIISMLAQVCAVALDSAAVGLGIVATIRCRTQTGCMRTLPTSLLTLLVMAVTLLLDIMQTWDIYRVIRAPIFSSSATQRVRVLFCWALPFAWLVNILMVMDSEWRMFAFTTAHLFVDPLVIIMANSNENAFVSTLIVIAIISDILSWYIQTDTLAKSAAMIQLGLSAGALIVLTFAQPPEAQEAVLVSSDKPNEEDDFEMTEFRALRKRKSGNVEIKF